MIIQLTKSAWIAARFIAGDTVTITVKESDGTAVALTSGTCVEVLPGQFNWSTTDIVTQPVVPTSYEWQMVNQDGDFQGGQFVFEDRASEVKVAVEGQITDEFAAIPAAVDAELSSNHTGGAWGAGTPGIRAITIQLYVGPATTTPIQNASIQIWNSDETSVIQQLISDANGRAIFNLDDASYKVRCAKALYTCNTYSLTVTGDATDIIYATAYVIPAPPPATDICTVYETLYDQSSNLIIINPTIATATIVDGPFDHTDHVHSKLPLSATFDSGQGQVSWQLPYGATVRFLIPQHGIEVIRTIPSSPTARLLDIA